MLFQLAIFCCLADPCILKLLILISCSNESVSASLTFSFWTEIFWTENQMASLTMISD